MSSFEQSDPMARVLATAQDFFDTLEYYFGIADKLANYLATLDADGTEREPRQLGETCGDGLFPYFIEPLDPASVAVLDFKASSDDTWEHLPVSPMPISEGDSLRVNVRNKTQSTTVLVYVLTGPAGGSPIRCGPYSLAAGYEYIYAGGGIFDVKAGRLSECLNPVATLEILSGCVEVRYFALGIWEEAFNGMGLCVGDAVRVCVGASGEANIKYTSGMVSRIGSIPTIITRNCADWANILPERIGKPIHAPRFPSFKWWLARFADGGALLGYDVASRLMRHYLGATGEPFELTFGDLNEGGEGDRLRQGIEASLKEGVGTLVTSNSNLVSGVLPQGSIQSEVSYSWHTLDFRFEGSLTPGLGTVQIQPQGEKSNSKVTLLYTFSSPNNLIIKASVPVELTDRYNWRTNSRVWINLDTNVIRINDTITVLDPSDPERKRWISVEVLKDIDLGSYEMQDVTGPNWEQDPDFAPVPCLPDSPDVGAIYRGSSREIFGTPDHPHAINEVEGRLRTLGMLPQEVILPFSPLPIPLDWDASDIYAGEFHELEANGEAKEFPVSAKWSQTFYYSASYTLGSDGRVASIQNISFINSTVP